MKLKCFVLLFLPFAACVKAPETPDLSPGRHDLTFENLAKSWDEAIPLGNGMLGALVWQNGDRLRLSLDRADLWDLRPMENLDRPEWRFAWVREQWENDNYGAVQELFDAPYDRLPAPSKIPAAALEWPLASLGEADTVRLLTDDAVCEVKWPGGARLLTFVHAVEPIGWFRMEGVDEEIRPTLIPPAYNLPGADTTENPVTGQDLRRLGYPQGEVISGTRQITYRQEGWGGFRYEVHVAWTQHGHILEGCWSISSALPGQPESPPARERVQTAMREGFRKALATHRSWWQAYWSRSSIRLPDPVLEKQWYLEQYKFGSAARRGAPPISLQAVWTADNGKLPPWKGDFHHDLNTQLSYWPAYSADHLEEEAGFLDWLWTHRDTFRRYTRTYFGTSGLNVPGVSTLNGEPMGGWIQYSFGPTVSAWLAQHFYLHWRYSMDRDFLAGRAYPWIREVAVHLDELSVPGPDGLRRLPLSSSPEINDNSRGAWFPTLTNFDLALIRWTFDKAAELALELGLTGDAEKWTRIGAEWPDPAVDPGEGLMIAAGVPYRHSHRHFSHLMAIHPLGIVDWSQGERSRDIIRRTVSQLRASGTEWWVGYSFSWLGNLQARMMDGDGAAQTLRIFAENFCLPNSFHVNGDQSGKGYSRFTYRPFTLEGNFAFAAGIQEMLLQSHAGAVQLFPAIPESWKEVSFDGLRAQGAFLVSAQRTQGKTTHVKIRSEAGGRLALRNPFGDEPFTINGAVFEQQGDLLLIDMQPGQELTVER